MIAYKLRVKYHHIPEEYFRQFNSMVRFAHNRILDNPTIKLNQVENIIKSTMDGIDLMDASFIKMAVDKAKSLPDRQVIFARKQFFGLKYNKSPKEEYLKKKNASIYLRGSKADTKGNRKATLDLENNRIWFKPSRSQHFRVEIYPDRRLKELKYLQSLCESGDSGFTLEVGRDHVSIIVDECNLTELYKSQNYKPKLDRILSFDMNPNYIGLVVMNDSGHQFHKEIIDLTELNKISNKNKKLHETAQITKRITDLAIHYQCSTVAYEKLSMKSKNHGLGKRYNRLVNNSWNRSRFIQILTKRCGLLTIKHQEIHAAYSSFVGCLTNPDDYDSIGAAIELNRRAQDLRKQSSYELFPSLKLKDLTTRWKEMLGLEISNMTWKELYDEFKKKPRLSYRNLFSLSKFNGFSFRLKSATSGAVCHEIACFD